MRGVPVRWLNHPRVMVWVILLMAMAGAWVLVAKLLLSAVLGE